MKRIICLILSIMMVLSVLSGCQAEQTVTADPPESSTPAQTQEQSVPNVLEPTTEEQINELNIPDLWKQ